MRIRTMKFISAICFSILAFASPQANAQVCSPAPVGLVSWYSGDGNALDARSRNNGTLQNGAGFAAGQVGQSFNLSGGSYISAASSLVTINSSLTVEAWVTPTSLVNNPVIFEKGVTQNNRFGFQIVADGSIGAYIDGGFFAVQSPVNTVPTNAFTHVAFVFDDTVDQSRLFVNGVLVASNNFPASISSNNGTVTIGESLTTGFTDFFDGRIDEVSLYNRVLSTSEIAAIANAGTAGKCKPTATTAPSGQVAWLAGDSNAGDIAGTNNGTLQNGATFAVGKVGQGFNFDGIDDAIEIPDAPSLNPTAQISMEAWVFPTADGADTVKIILNKESLSTLQYEIARKGNGICQNGNGIPTGNFVFFINGLSGLPNDCVGFVNGNAALPLNSWSYVALTYDGVNLRSYVNGLLTRTVAVSGTITTTKAI